MQLLSCPIFGLLGSVTSDMLTAQPLAAPRLGIRVASGTFAFYLSLSDRWEGSEASPRLREAIPFFSFPLVSKTMTYQNEVPKITVYFKSKALVLESGSCRIHTIIHSWLSGGGVIRSESNPEPGEPPLLSGLAE